jgi:hypothetical protein
MLHLLGIQHASRAAFLVTHVKWQQQQRVGLWCSERETVTALILNCPIQFACASAFECPFWFSCMKCQLLLHITYQCFIESMQIYILFVLFVFTYKTEIIKWLNGYSVSVLGEKNKRHRLFIFNLFFQIDRALKPQIKNETDGKL